MLLNNYYMDVAFESNGAVLDQRRVMYGDCPLAYRTECVASRVAEWIDHSKPLLAFAEQRTPRSSATAGPSPKRLPAGTVLAVLELKNKVANAKTDLVAYFGDLVRAAALRAEPDLKVITRENLLVLLAAQGKNLAECEGECEVETGRRIGADLVISGELLEVGRSLKLNLKLHDTHEGRLLSGAVAAGADIDELDRHTGAAVAELIAPLTR